MTKEIESIISTTDTPSDLMCHVGDWMDDLCSLCQVFEDKYIDRPLPKYEEWIKLVSTFRGFQHALSWTAGAVHELEDYMHKCEQEERDSTRKDEVAFDR